MAQPDMGPINLELADVLEEAVAEWVQKRDDYGAAFLELGAKGQFSDIWRKVFKLKNSVWEGQELTGETPEKIAKELIPHCLMLVYCLRHEL